MADMTLAGEPAGAWLKRLFSRRLIFVMGKGGVGKTTISVALAYAAQRMNKKILLVEIGDADSIGKLYLERPLPDFPRQLMQNIWGVRVEPRAELEAYVRAHVTPGFIAGKIIRSRLFDYLFEATPGLKEVMSLGRLWRWEKDENNPSGSSFDLIIVDAPATGHGISLLRLPDLLIKMIRVGPVANQIRVLQRLLKNHQKTGLVLVALPEELPVNEAMEFYSEAEETLDMPVAATFINCVYPAAFSPNEIQQIEFLESSHLKQFSSVEKRILASAGKIILHRRNQQKHIDEICAKAKNHVQEVPFCFTNDLSVDEIQKLSSFNFPVC